MARVILVSADLIAWPAIAGIARQLGVTAHIAENAQKLEAILPAAPNPSDAASGVQGTGDARAAAAKSGASSDDLPGLVLIDLATPGLEIANLAARLQGLPRPPAIVAFGPHVHTARLEAAVAAGCHEVLSRGQLLAQLPAILRRYAAAP